MEFYIYLLHSDIDAVITTSLRSYRRSIWSLIEGSLPQEPCGDRTSARQLPQIEMSDQNSIDKLKRFSFGDHIPIVLAADIDNNEVNALFDQVSSCFEFLLGGRATVTYSKEVKFLSCLLYYAISIHQDQCTSGQDFSGLRLLQSRSIPIPDNSPTSVVDVSSLMTVLMKEVGNIFGTSTSSRTVFSPLNIQKGDTVYMALAMSTLPYLYSRRSEISSVMAESYVAFTAKEEHSSTSNANISAADGANIFERDTYHTNGSSNGASSNNSDPTLPGDDTERIGEGGIGEGEGEGDERNRGSASHRNNVDSGGLVAGASMTVPDTTSTSTSATTGIATTAVIDRSSDNTSPSPSLNSRVDALITRLFNANSRFQSSSPYNNTGPQGLLGWLEALHLFYFLRNGR